MKRLVIAALLVGASGCTGSAAATTITGIAGHPIDGDTVRVKVNGVVRKVRLIGIDSPEVFGGVECGGREASRRMRQLLSPGERVTLTAVPGNTRDHYRRWLFYVSTSDDGDLGGRMIREHRAVARYDSQDGYPHHPKQAQYRRLSDGIRGCYS